MFTTDLPEYVIDLDRAEPDRWREVIAAEADAARQLRQPCFRLARPRRVQSTHDGGHGALRTHESVSGSSSPP